MNAELPGKAPNAARTALRTAAIMLLFTLVFTAVMAYTYHATRPAIEASREQEQMRLVDEVLPPGSYDNALLEDYVVVGSRPPPGVDKGARIWRARRAGEPVALVIEALAPDGYAGRIALLVALGADGRVSGVRVTAHKETPGLGDYIDPRKDRDKHSPWIAQFAGRSDEPASWLPTKDGGTLAYRSGATISARAVGQAVGRAAGWARAQGRQLYDAPAGSRLP